MVSGRDLNTNRKTVPIAIALLFVFVLPLISPASWESPRRSTKELSELVVSR